MQLLRYRASAISRALGRGVLGSCLLGAPFVACSSVGESGNAGAAGMSGAGLTEQAGREQESGAIAGGDAVGGATAGGVAIGGASNADAGNAGTADNGAEAGTDSGGEAPATAFDGAPPYEPVVVPAAKASCGVDPSARPCLSCHNVLHSTPFMAGGTIFEDASKSSPVAAAEVRIVSQSSGSVYLAHSDADGNFWLKRPSVADNGPYLIGIRKDTVVQSMPLVQQTLDCNSAACHGSTFFGPIHLFATD